MSNPKKAFDFKKYYEEHKDQYRKNMTRFHIARSLKKANHKFTPRIKEQVETVKAEINNVKRGRAFKYQTDEERNAMNKLNRQLAMKRFCERKKQDRLYKIEMERLLIIDNIFE